MIPGFQQIGNCCAVQIFVDASVQFRPDGQCWTLSSPVAGSSTAFQASYGCKRTLCQSQYLAKGVFCRFPGQAVTAGLSLQALYDIVFYLR